jgi:multidrug efflux pump subunit AcrA (membrane-fusion protein)
VITDNSNPNGESEVETIVSRELESLAQATSPVFPIVINFAFKGQQRSEQLVFGHPVSIPSRGEIVTLKFNDFGTITRISGTVDSTVREFYGPGSVPGVKAAGHIVQIMLAGVTEQKP